MDSALVWFRRDLRLDDHAALYHALKQARRVYCAFVFDREILDPLLAAGRADDRRVEFIHDSLHELDQLLRANGGALIVRHGVASEAIVALAEELGVDAVFTNHDYEPTAIARDDRVAAALRVVGRALHTFKDQVIFERREVMTGSATPFAVFTPYKAAWLRQLDAFQLRAYPVDKYLGALAKPRARTDTPAL